MEENQFTMSLLERDEKIPVSKQETVIVVSRTLREQNDRRRRWLVLKLSLIAIFAVWLVWAIFFTPVAKA